MTMTCTDSHNLEAGELEFQHTSSDVEPGVFPLADTQNFPFIPLHVTFYFQNCL